MGLVLGLQIVGVLNRDLVRDGGYAGPAALGIRFDCLKVHQGRGLNAFSRCFDMMKPPDFYWLICIADIDASAAPGRDGFKRSGAISIVAAQQIFCIVFQALQGIHALGTGLHLFSDVIGESVKICPSLRLLGQ